MKFCQVILPLLATSWLLACGGSSTPSTQIHTPPPKNQWTWMNGSNLVNQPGNYGVQGMSSSSSVPPPRAQAYSWIDSSGTFWLFGGAQAPTGQSETLLNDLWKFSGGQWTWVEGPSTPNQPGVWGSQGVAASGNIPSPRQGGASWTDRSGNFWLFGGIGLDANGKSDYLNDLWQYAGGQWTWVSGSQAGGHLGVYGTQGISAVTNVPGARQFAASWADGNGNLWLFGGLGIDSAGNTDYLNDLWEYTTGQWVWIGGSNVIDQPGTYGAQGVASPGNIPGARSESMAWSDRSGNLWLFGGSPGPDGQFRLLNDLWEFSTGGWTWVSGSSSTDQPGNYGTQGTTTAANMPGARASAMTWTDSSGNLWLFGGDENDSTGQVRQLNDLWKYDGTNWTWIAGANVAGQSGNYGTMGTAGSGNIPGARSGAVAWIDSSGSIWLFGGNGYDSTGNLGYLNDLWKYQP